MVSDIEVTEDRDIRIDSTGDIATVSGYDNVVQQHVNALFRAGDSTQIGEVRKIDAEQKLFTAVKDELSDLEYVTSIEEITVDRKSRRAFEVTVETNVTDEALEEVVIA